MNQTYGMIMSLETSLYPPAPFKQSPHRKTKQHLFQWDVHLSPMRKPPSRFAAPVTSRSKLQEFDTWTLGSFRMASQRLRRGPCERGMAERGIRGSVIRGSEDPTQRLIFIYSIYIWDGTVKTPYSSSTNKWTSSVLNGTFS